MKIESIQEQKAKQFSRFKQQWKEVADKRIFARSKWEYRYALYLNMLKQHSEIKDWAHEPTTFWFEGIKRGTNNYKPDFLVYHNNGSEEYIEVKGYATPKDRTKWKRMAKYHPQVLLRIIDGEWFKKNTKALKVLIREWE